MDLRAAFDSVDKDILWEVMARKEISVGIKEIYKETKNIIKLGEKVTEEFWTKGGIRQGCCLSPTLFTLYIADMEGALRETLTTGIKVGKMKFCSVAYADDIVILAKREEDMKQLMRKLEIYLDKRKLTLNLASGKNGKVEE